MHLFYTPDISSDNYTLSEEESKHAIRVLRLSKGDTIVLIDGKGGWYDAEIENDNPKSCSAKIIKTQKEFGKRSSHLHIAIAPTKNMDRLEWFIEKACEIGIDKISLINCKNSERTVVKTERIHKVAIAAIKQSLKAYLPAINETSDFKKFISTVSTTDSQKIIAHCINSDTKTHLKNLYRQGNDAIILIGPEGDFTTDEVQLALNNGFQEISLGSARLRTETAALYACTAFNILNE